MRQAPILWPVSLRPFRRAKGLGSVPSRSGVGTVITGISDAAKSLVPWWRGHPKGSLRRVSPTPRCTSGQSQRIHLVGIHVVADNVVSHFGDSSGQTEVPRMCAATVLTDCDPRQQNAHRWRPTRANTSALSSETEATEQQHGAAESDRLLSDSE